MIILNEKEFAKRLIDDPHSGSSIFNSLVLVARYYLDEGFEKNETRKKLDYFMLQYEPGVSLVKVSDMLDTALKKALKRKNIIIESVDITKPELEIIDSLKGKMIKRLAFTVLCVAKYWHLVNGKDYWTNNEDKEIMKMANINTSIKRQDALYRELRDLGLISFSKKIDNTNIKVEFVQDGEVILKINDFRNLGFQYMRYTGGNFYECQNCGLVCKLNRTDPRGRLPKYCTDCACEVHIKQTVNSVMNMRSAIKKIKMG